MTGYPGILCSSTLCKKSQVPTWYQEAISPGDIALIRIRDNAGQSNQEYALAARVIAPDESFATASATLAASEWVILNYPGAFSGGNTQQLGAYTILWETEGVLIVCDGFVVGSSGQ